jgi:hypothetical protein
MIKPHKMVEINRKFDGKIGNLLGNSQAIAISSEFRGFGRGPTDDGKYWAYFDLTPGGPANPPAEFHLYFVFPAMPAGQILATNTQSRAVDAWFFRSDDNYSNNVFVIKDDQELMSQRGGMRMAGQVRIIWKSDADFDIGADLTLPDDKTTWVRGKFIGNVTTDIVWGADSP